MDEMKADEKHGDSAYDVQETHITLTLFGNRVSMDGDDLIMRRFGIIMRKILATLLRNDCSLVVRAGNRANRIDRLPMNNGDELYFVADIPPKKIAAQVAFDFAKAA